MKRTTIMLPRELKNLADRAAQQLGISFGEFVCHALRVFLDRGEAGVVRDPLFEDDAVFDGELPTDGARRHDDYLFGHSQ